MPNTFSPPPSGDPTQAERYVSQLTSLIETDKLNVLHTDLSKFDPSALQDHYLLNLMDYQVEISHSKHPNSGQDSYVILFTNIKNLAQNNCQKIVLAYMHLDTSQFARFKKAANEQLERKKRVEEEKRLKTALDPVDQILQDLTTNSQESDEDPLNKSFPQAAVS